MATFQNLSDRLDAIEKFIGGSYADVEKTAYVEELHTKFMTPEEKQEWADTSAERIKERDAAKANAPKAVAPKSASPSARPVAKSSGQSVTSVSK